MAFPILAALGVVATWLGRIGLAALAVNEIAKLTQGQKDVINDHTTSAAASGLPKDEQKKLVAATTYEQVEKSGKSPDDFWNGLSETEKAVLEYSPDTVRSSMGRTSFLGIAQTVLWVAAAAAAGLAAFRGIPIVSTGLGKLVAARARNASALELMTVIEEVKMGVLARVWIPGTVAGIAAAGGWLTGALANNMNDAFLWGPTFLDQAAKDVEKARLQLEKDKAAQSASFTDSNQPRIIIRMVEEKKPEQFIGTLFSAKLGDMKSFERHVDDEITDEADLLEDAKLNLNRWLASMPGRLGYSIVIRKNPVDEYGVQQSGTWATMTTHFTRLNGGIQPVDTILLGPVSPTTRLVLSKTLKTIEQQLPGTLQSQQVRVVEMPSGVIDIFGSDGERVEVGKAAPVTKAPAVAPAAPAPVAEPVAPVPPIATPASAPVAPVAPVAPSIPVPTSFGVQTTTPAVATPPAPVVAPTPTFTAPAAPADEYDRSKYFGGTRGAKDPRWPWYGNQIVQVSAGGSNLNVRDGIGTAATIKFKLVDGTKVVFTRWVGIRDDQNWGEIVDTAGGRTGFAALEYLKPI